MELPPLSLPEEHFLHPDVVSFVKTGIIPPPHFGCAFLPVFTALERSAGATPDVGSTYLGHGRLSQDSQTLIHRRDNRSVSPTRPLDLLQ